MTVQPRAPLRLRAQEPADTHASVHRWLMGGLTAWLALVLLLAGTGLLAQLPTQLLPAPIALSLTALLLLYARVPAFRDYLHALDLRTLSLFNVWRIPAALAFFHYGAQGELPAAFVRNAAWGDLIAGVLAIPVALWALGFGRRLAAFTGYHLFSITDFVVAVGTGFYFSLLGDPLMGTLKHLPMAVIPLFGVPITGAFSLMTLHRLFTRRA